MIERMGDLQALPAAADPTPTMSSGDDRCRSRTLTAGELIAQLSKVPPDTPVVMRQSDEPSGDYGVRSVEFVDMKREPLYARIGTDVWHEADYLDEYVKRRNLDKFDAPQRVVYLNDELPYLPTIDAEIQPAALPATPPSAYLYTYPGNQEPRTDVHPHPYPR